MPVAQSGGLLLKADGVHAIIIGADVEPADVVAPDDQDVRFGLSSCVLFCHLYFLTTG
jgi:hypothetical protein